MLHGSGCYTGRFSRKESPWPPEAKSNSTAGNFFIAKKVEKYENIVYNIEWMVNDETCHRHRHRKVQWCEPHP
jgi:hypothetical protein